MQTKIKNVKYLLLVNIVLLVGYQSFAQEHKLIDKEATPETKKLYQNLFKLLDKGIMFGHQDDLAYGVKWKYQEGRSDVYDVVKDYPAVFGWDLGHIEHKSKNNLDTVPFKKIKEYIKTVYDHGGVNTLSWHMDNPKTGGAAWENTKAIASVLPGGENNKEYKKWLKRGAKFIKRLRGSDGKHIPILFRPFHELNGNWFWWGKESATAEEYKNLYKYTVDYLMNKQHVHNSIYIYNTNSFSTAKEFTERYPGDNYVDVMSFDNYQFTPKNAKDSVVQASLQSFKKQVKNSLSILDSVSEAHHKLPTFAETGYATIPVANWWTATLWDVIKDYKLSYFLVWRNYGWQEKEQAFHYYAPYLGHPSVPDFQKFYNLKGTLFQSDVAKENLYK
jgi:mannan endo-1,4-beta-mannosidase